MIVYSKDKSLKAQSLDNGHVCVFVNDDNEYKPMASMALKKFKNINFMSFSDDNRYLALSHSKRGSVEILMCHKKTWYNIPILSVFRDLMRGSVAIGFTANSSGIVVVKDTACSRAVYVSMEAFLKTDVTLSVQRLKVDETDFTTVYKKL